MSYSQFSDVLVLNILGTGLLCVPYIAENNGLLPVAAGLTAGFLLVLLSEGVRIESRLLCVLYFFKTIIISAMLLRLFSELISVTLLHDTGAAAISGVMILTVMYGSSAGSAARGRMARLFGAAVYAVVFISILLSLKNADISRLMPVKAEKDMLHPAALTGLMFFPAELRYFEKDKNTVAAKAAIAGGVLVLAAVFVRQLCFNTVSEFPVIDLSYNGIFSNTAARHQESVLILCITVLVYFLLESQLYSAGMAFEKAFGAKGGLVIGAVLIFIFCLLPRSLSEVRDVLYKALVAGGVVFLLLVPIFRIIKRLGKKTGAIAAIILFTGCSGSDPEAREYVLGMFAGRENITLAAAKLTEDGSEVTESVFYDGKGETIAEALHDIDRRTGKKIYMGHTLLCAVEKSAIDKDRMSAIATIFQSDDDLSRGVAVAAVDNIEDLKKENRDGGDIAAFIREYGKSSSQGSAMQVNSLLYTLTETDGDAVLPIISFKNGEIGLDGGAVIKNYVYAGDITKDEFEALQWLMSDKNEIVIDVNGSAFLFGQKGLKRSFKDGVTFTVSARARLIQGSGYAERYAAEKALANRIAAAVTKLEKEFDCDCLEVSGRYARISGKEADFKNLPVNIKVRTEWKGM